MKSVFSELQFLCKARADKSIEGNKSFYSPPQHGMERGLAFRVFHLYMTISYPSVNQPLLLLLFYSFLLRKIKLRL